MARRPQNRRISAIITTDAIPIRHRVKPDHLFGTNNFISYAAGVLIAASFLHLVPESMKMNSNAPAWLLAGFAGMHLFHRTVCGFVCERHHVIKPGIGIVAILRIAFHSFIDGIVYAIAYHVSLFTGTIAAVGMVLHEFPEGIVTYVRLVHGRFPQRTALWVAFGAAALTTPLGTLAAFLFIDRIDAPMLGALLSLSAGMLVYVGATHLLPEAEHQRRPFTWAAFGAGVTTAILILLTE